MSATKTHITRIGTVVVPVSDQGRALRFLTKTLGFETRIDGEVGAGERWIEVAPRAPRRRSLSSTRRRTRSASRPPTRTPRMRSSGRVGFDTDAEVLRLGEGMPAMSMVRDRDSNRYRVVERD